MHKALAGEAANDSPLHRTKKPQRVGCSTRPVTRQLQGRKKHLISTHFLTTKRLERSIDTNRLDN